ncbi:phage terminase large subunit [Aquimarina macrocephali]|uniref:phage terminase large subunit n=1 Tax=Aquimarina macrocephali TaxID=666563 RepID=UPI003F673AE7
MKIIPSSYSKPIFTEDFYEADVWGGRARGGSHNITLHALFKMRTSIYFRGYFVRAIQSSIRDSLWQDFKDRIEEVSDINSYDYLKDFKINDSSMSAIYLPNGNIIKSKGFRASTKANTANMKSIAGATHVYIEECEEVGEEEYNKLADSLRTTKGKIQIIRSWNPPPKEHWLVRNYHNTIDSQYEGYYDLEPKGIPNHISVKGTYYDNIKNIDHNTRARYERYKDTTPKYYYSQIKGLVSDGGHNKVYNNWKRVSLRDYLNMDFPAVYGLDIGDTAPNALGEHKYNDGKFYDHEMLYKSSRQLKSEATEINKGVLVDKLEMLGVRKQQPMIVDGAAKDAIRELRNAGYNARPSDKSPGSVKSGIEFINRAENYYTDTSINYESEYNGYYLETDQYKVPIDGKPIKGNDHLMDESRYAKVWMRKKYRITL